jgi:hypothetical protein
VGKVDGRIAYYRVDFAKGDMLPLWNKVILVPRGRRPPQQIATPSKPLTKNSTPRQIRVETKKLLRKLKRSVAVDRLECDIQFKDKSGKKLFGPLCLFQFPRTLGNEVLLAFQFRADGNPEGIGADGSD